MNCCKAKQSIRATMCEIFCSSKEKVAFDDVFFLLFAQCSFVADPRAMCLSEVILGSRRDLNRLRRAAELGYGFAQVKQRQRKRTGEFKLLQARMARESKGQERFYWAHKSAAQKERDGKTLICRWNANFIFS
jgi:hypothetical protein